MSSVGGMPADPSPPLRVLVVDDDFLVAKVHTGFVEQVEGFSVVGSARDGAEALRLAERERPDVVLLDVHLPDLSGLEVLRRMRAAGVTSDVLMVTAERDVDAVQQARAAGAVGYLVKPFTRDDLQARLADVRRARSRLDALASAGEQAAEQSDIDQVFGVRAEHGTTLLPKGLNRQTGDLVLAALADGELSATECAEQLGLSRVTARRYLEHFVETGAATARQQYGRVGRPERRYALRAG